MTGRQGRRWYVEQEEFDEKRATLPSERQNTKIAELTFVQLSSELKVCVSWRWNPVESGVNINSNSPWMERIDEDWSTTSECNGRSFWPKLKIEVAKRAKWDRRWVPLQSDWKCGPNAPTHSQIDQVLGPNWVLQAGSSRLQQRILVKIKPMN
jgi:hypothetical protein